MQHVQLEERKESKQQSPFGIIKNLFGPS